MQALALIRNPQLIVVSLAVVIALMLNSGRQALPASDVAAIQEAIALVDAGALVIDVRESPKTHLPGALLIPLEVLSARLSTMEVAKTQTIVVYCGNGSRLGPRAAHALTQAGYRHVVNLQPGIEGWRKARLPLVAA
jgi:rhodanese-related sulfurtransferase